MASRTEEHAVLVATATHPYSTGGSDFQVSVSSTISTSLPSDPLPATMGGAREIVSPDPDGVLACPLSADERLSSDDVSMRTEINLEPDGVHIDSLGCFVPSKLQLCDLVDPQLERQSCDSSLCDLDTVVPQLMDSFQPHIDGFASTASAVIIDLSGIAPVSSGVAWIGGADDAMSSLLENDFDVSSSSCPPTISMFLSRLLFGGCGVAKPFDPGIVLRPFDPGIVPMPFDPGIFTGVCTDVNLLRLCSSRLILHPSSQSDGLLCRRRRDSFCGLPESSSGSSVECSSAIAPLLAGRINQGRLNRCTSPLVIGSAKAAASYNVSCLEIVGDLDDDTLLVVICDVIFDSLRSLDVFTLGVAQGMRISVLSPSSRCATTPLMCTSVRRRYLPYQSDSPSESLVARYVDTFAPPTLDTVTFHSSPSCLFGRWRRRSDICGAASPSSSVRRRRSFAPQLNTLQSPLL
jgi:hypothetical protein